MRLYRKSLKTLPRSKSPHCRETLYYCVESLLYAAFWRVFVVDLLIMRMSRLRDRLGKSGGSKPLDATKPEIRSVLRCPRPRFALVSGPY